MKNLVTKTALFLLVSAPVVAGQQGGFGGGGFGGGFANPNSRGNSRIVTADQGLRNAENKRDNQEVAEEIAIQKASQYSINGKCSDEQNAWKVIAPTKTKHKNYPEALELYNKAIDAFNTEKNKKNANSICEQTLTKALELLK